MEEITTIEFQELERKIYTLVCNLGCAILKNILETQDMQLMKNRDKKEYRHKGYRQATIKTLMGEVEYNRAIYKKEKEHVFLLDNTIKISKVGEISYNLAEQMLKSVVNTSSYRKASEEVKNLTNQTISHETLHALVWEVGKMIEDKEKEEIKLYKENKLIEGTKQVPALFEEADGLWYHLQGKDRKKAIEKYKKECEKKNKEFNSKKRFNAEVKLHIMYEGWQKVSKNRYKLVNKKVVSGMMSPKHLKDLKNARIYQLYDLNSIELRASNGDGASWINNIMSKDTICQKDSFHIQQEIVRDIQNKQYREELATIIKEKRYNEVQVYIENLKYELGGEEKTVKKLKKLQDYLKTGLERYTDILKKHGKEIPHAPQGIEYKTMGTMESNIFSVLEVRLCSGRKAFVKNGANYLAKVCAEYYENKDIKLQAIESEIPIDNSIEEWIKEIEENVKKNKKIHRTDRKEIEEYRYNVGTLTKDLIEINELVKYVQINSLMYR